MPSLTIERFVSPPIETNVYLVVDESARRALVIDPSCAAARVLERCAEKDWTIETVALTHGHPDHTRDTALLARKTGARVLAHELTAPLLSDPILSGAAWMGITLEPCAVSGFLNEADAVQVGGVALRVLHTPGHSPGCVCLWGDGVCFTGDVLFSGGVGRWDLPGGNQRVLAQSLERLVSTLEDNTVIYPGHGPSSTIAREKQENPFLRND